MLTKGKLLEMLERQVKEYRTDANASLRRNSHQNEDAMNGRADIPQNVIDALLVDFVNYVGVQQGLDYGLRTENLRRSPKIR